MGIFGNKKEEKEKVEKAEALVTTAPSKVSMTNTSTIITRPRITEKAALLGEKGVYTFEIQAGATKHEVRDAIKEIYKVTPEKVRIVNKVARHSMSRSKGRSVMEHGLRKAYVYLKDGDRIELV